MCCVCVCVCVCACVCVCKIFCGCGWVMSGSACTCMSDSTHTHTHTHLHGCLGVLVCDESACTYMCDGIHTPCNISIALHARTHRVSSRLLSLLQKRLAEEKKAAKKAAREQAGGGKCVPAMVSLITVFCTSRSCALLQLCIDTPWFYRACNLCQLLQTSTDFLWTTNVLY